MLVGERGQSAFPPLSASCQVAFRPKPIIDGRLAQLCPLSSVAHVRHGSSLNVFIWIAHGGMPSGGGV